MSLTRTKKLTVLELVVNNENVQGRIFSKVSEINYKQLYDQYSKAMFNTALRIVNNYDDAQDVLQESFIDAFKGLDKFQNRSTFGAWIKRIVINKSINKIKRDQVNFLPVEDEMVTETSDTYNEENIELKVEKIKTAILLLPAGYRTVISLRLMENLPFIEIAVLLKIAESSVRTQYIRGKRKLLELLNNDL